MNKDFVLSGTINIVSASDDKYSKYLGVMLFSLLSNTKNPKNINIFVLDGGIKDNNKKKLEQQILMFNSNIHFVGVDKNIFNNLKISDHINHVAYYRIVIPELLINFNRVIYLDCDLIVKNDIVELWNIDLCENYVAAVEDISIFNRHDDLHMINGSRYFNSGVMIIDIKKWKENDITKKTIDFLNLKKEFILWWDQDGLNSTLCNKWKKLPARWNQQTDFLNTKSISHTGFSDEEFFEAVNRPAIIHYTTNSKPWEYLNEHPLKYEYLFYLNKSVWKNFKLEGETFSQVLGKKDNIINKKRELINEKEKIIHEMELIIKSKDNVLDEKELLLKEKDELLLKKELILYDFYHSWLITPVIRFRGGLRRCNKIFQYAKSKIKNLIIFFIKKYFNKEARMVIHFLNDFKNKIWAKTVVVSNKKWDGVLISVVTPYYNAGGTIKETVNSVLSQTFQNFEYIIVDDGSTDKNSIEIFDDIKNVKITKIRKENGGVASARNLGISVAKGKYILCLDADDILDPTYIEKFLIILESNLDIDIVYSHMKFFGIENGFYSQENFDPYTLFFSNYITTAAIFRKKIWNEFGGYKCDIGFEDWEFWVNSIEKGAKARLLSEYVFNYRRAIKSRYVDDLKEYEKNISKIKELHPNYLKKILKKRGKWIAYSNIFRDGTQYINLNNSFLYKRNNPKNKNILLLVPWISFGGAETLLYNYCSKLKDDFNFFVITGLKSSNEWEGKFKEITENIFHLPNLFSSEDYYLDFIINFIKTRNIDTVHIVHNSSFYRMLPKIKKQFPEMRVISTVFNTLAIHFNESISFSEYIDVYTTDNSKILKAYNEKDVLKNKKKIVIHNGVDCKSKFNVAKYNKNDERLKLGIKDDELSVYFIGRLSPEKNPDIFIQAAKRILKNNKKVKFFIIGDGPMKNELSNLIGGSYSENIFYLGYQTDIPKYLSTADLFILPSKTEGFPLSIIEAMAMGVCVLASDVGGVSDAITDGETGFLISPNSVDDLVAKIKNILDNKGVIDKISKKAREEVSNKFSIEILSEKYKNLYNKDEKS